VQKNKKGEVIRMKKFGQKVVKYRVLIFVISLLLLIPSAFGFITTRINYDILSYLPQDMETMKGQDILLDEFGTGAFSLCVVEGMDEKDISAMRKDMEKVEHVKSVIWYDSIAGLTVPMDVLPNDIQEFFNNKDADSTLMIVLYDSSMSSDETMDAVKELRKVASKDCYISGMSSVVTDIKVDYNPIKTDYLLDESIDLTGLEGNVVYNSGVTKKLQDLIAAGDADTTVSYDFSKAGKTQVTILM